MINTWLYCISFGHLYKIRIIGEEGEYYKVESLQKPEPSEKFESCFHNIKKDTFKFSEYSTSLEKAKEKYRQMNKKIIDDLEKTIELHKCSLEDIEKYTDE